MVNNNLEELEDTNFLKAFPKIQMLHKIFTILIDKN